MMKTTRTIISSLILCSLLNVSCIKSELISTSEGVEQSDEYLIFGTYYGFFEEESNRSTYKLTESALYEDKSNSWDISKAEFTQLSYAKFKLVNDLIQAIPSELIILNDSTFGCPNCADQGGINIEYSKNGVVKRWEIDQYNGRNPEFLHEFRDQVNEKVQLLNL